MPINLSTIDAPVAMTFPDGWRAVRPADQHASESRLAAMGVTKVYVHQPICLVAPNGTPAAMFSLNAYRPSDPPDQVFYAQNPPPPDVVARVVEAAAVITTRLYCDLPPDRPLKEGRNRLADRTVWIKDGRLHNENGPAYEHDDGEREWRINGLFHRADGPAIVKGQDESWFLNGLAHRDGGPASTQPGCESWYRHGKLHRDGGLPAVLYEGGARSWYVDGALHRDDGPAYVGVEGQRWLQNGVLHRLDGPAMVGADGSWEWRHNGVLHREDGPALRKKNGREERWLSGKRVRDPFLANWLEIALALGDAATGKESGRTRYTLSRLLQSIVDKLEANGVSSFTAEAASMVAHSCHAESRQPYSLTPATSLRAKLVFLAAALASGDFDGVAPADRAALAALLSNLPKTPPLRLVPDPERKIPSAVVGAKAAALLVEGLSSATPPRTPKASGPVAFIYDRETTSARKARTRAAASGSADLNAVDPTEAAIVARLATDDGGCLDLREHEGALYRPVLAPGSWRPCTEAEFRRAAGSGEPWADNPFRDRPTNGACSLSVPEAVLGGPAAAKNEDADRAATEALIAAIGRLLVIDGAVYRRTTAPEIAVAASDVDGGARRWRLAWALGDGLAQTDSQATIHDSSIPRPSDEQSPFRIPPAPGSADHHREFFARQNNPGGWMGPALRLPLSGAALLRETLSEAVRLGGLSETRGAGRIPVAFPDAPDHDPSPALAILARALLLVQSTFTAATPRLPAAAAEVIAAIGTPGDEDRLLTSLDSLRDAVLGGGFSPQAPQAFAVALAGAVRDAILSRKAAVEAEDDDESLSFLAM